MKSCLSDGEKDAHRERPVKAEWKPGPAEGCGVDPRWC